MTRAPQLDGDIVERAPDTIRAGVRDMIDLERHRRTFVDGIDHDHGGGTRSIIGKIARDPRRRCELSDLAGHSPIRGFHQVRVDRRRREIGLGQAEE